jgi:hypothetical protein
MAHCRFSPLCNVAAGILSVLAAEGPHVNRVGSGVASKPVVQRATPPLSRFSAVARPARSPDRRNVNAARFAVASHSADVFDGHGLAIH